MKKGFMMLLVLMLLLGMCTIVSAVTVPDEIRVGIYYGSKGVSSVEISCDAGMKIGIIDDDGDFDVIEEIEPGETVVAKKGGDKHSVKISGLGEFGDDENYVCFISDENRDGDKLISINGTVYRGDVELKRFSDSDMTVINVVSMQEYLYGVVPREIGGNSPIEAVKAQAIIARTYAAKNYNKRIKWGFNLLPTVDDQAYGGYKWENPNSNRAVDETNGMVATYDGELIGGYYFSTSGGYTENSENVWGGKLDYLKSVPDIYEPEDLNKKTWSVTLSADEVEDRLAEHNIYVGDVIDLVPTKLSEVGRVIELKVIGSDDTVLLSKEKVRTYLKLDSQWYTVNDEPPKVAEYIVEDEKHTNNRNDRDDIYIYEDEEEIEKEEKKKEKKKKEIKPLLQKLLDIVNGKDEAVEMQVEYSAKRAKGEFVIQGRGWGHAVGMSQNGAKGMAENGFDCEEIIKWYYSGVEISSN